METPPLISYQDYLQSKNKRVKKFFYVNDIKYSLLELNILTKKELKGLKKSELQNKLFEYYDKISIYYKNIDKIKLLQKNIRIFIKNKNKAIYGDVIENRSKSHNDTDFYTFNEIATIPKEYLFSYTDKNKFIYSFDIRSFLKLLETNNENPYNREQIPDYAIELYKKRIEYIKNNNIYIEPFEEDILTPEQKFNERVLKIFQTIDLLNATAGGTNPQWFHNLDVLQLKNYYKVLEDVWNYRAELTPAQKYDIVYNTEMFPVSVSKIFLLNDKRRIQKIILKEIEKLLYTSQSDIHRSTACYYILISFTEISSECAQDMPWLIQY